MQASSLVLGDGYLSTQYVERIAYRVFIAAAYRSQRVNTAGIGLDGVFLVVDTFDGAPPELTLEDRVHYTMSRAGPSIIIASLTDICAFLTAAFTPIPAITYFCVTVAFSLIIAVAVLFTWFTAWLYEIEKTRMAKSAVGSEFAKVNAGNTMVPTLLELSLQL